MKKVLYIVIALGMINTFAGAAEWMNLSDKACDKYGKGTCHLGSAYTCGCFGDLTRVKKICRQAGGRLPSSNEIKRVSKSCGVIVTRFGSNETDNRAYESCISRKGFQLKKYWTTDYVYKDSKGYLIGIDFYHAHTTSLRSFIANAYVRCIK